MADKLNLHVELHPIHIKLHWKEIWLSLSQDSAWLLFGPDWLGNYNISIEIVELENHSLYNFFCCWKSLNVDKKHVESHVSLWEVMGIVGIGKPIYHYSMGVVEFENYFKKLCLKFEFHHYIALSKCCLAVIGHIWSPSKSALKPWQTNGCKQIPPPPKHGLKRLRWRSGTQVFGRTNESDSSQRTSAPRTIDVWPSDSSLACAEKLWALSKAFDDDEARQKSHARLNSQFELLANWWSKDIC